MAANDLEVILSALGKERAQLHEKLMQMDRIIKKIRSGNYSNNTPNENMLVLAAKVNEQKTIGNAIASTTDLKVQILLVMDDLKKASKLKDVQSHYFKLTRNSYNIRETLRSLNRSGLLKMLRERTSGRGVLWIKTEWIENQLLKEEYKPMGFDVIYRPDNIEFL